MTYAQRLDELRKMLKDGTISGDEYYKLVFDSLADEKSYPDEEDDGK